MKIPRYAIDYQDEVGFKVATGEWCKATDIVYLEQRIERLEKALEIAPCQCRRMGMLVDGVHCERCKALGLPPG